MTKRKLPIMSLARFDVLRARRDEAARREREAGASAREWYKIVNEAQKDEATVYIYDEIGYWGVTASDFASDLRDITASKIKLRINSPGGECYDGIAIYNTLVQHSAQVDVQVDALAASAASFIAMAGDRVEVCQNAEMMIHDASGFCWGNAAEMRRMVEMLDRMSDNIASIYAARAGGTLADWRAVMQEERWYSAREAVSAKLADKVVGDPEPEDLPDSVEGEVGAEVEDRAPKAKVFDLSVFRFAGRSAAPAPAANIVLSSPRLAVVAKARAARPPGTKLARVRHRPYAYDPLQPRGDDGKWIDGLPDGISGTNYMDLESWSTEYEAYDESVTDAGLVATSMVDGSAQLSYDHPGDSDHRYVIADLDSGESLRELADGIEIALERTDEGDEWQAEVGSLATINRAEGEITLTFHGAGDNGVDLEFTIDEDEARTYAENLRFQADQADEALDVDAVWSGQLTAMITDDRPLVDDWAELAATMLTTDADDPFAALREALA